MSPRKSEPKKKAISGIKPTTSRNRGASPKSVTGRRKPALQKDIVRKKSGKGEIPKKNVKSRAKKSSPAKKTTTAKKAGPVKKLASKRKADQEKKAASKRKADTEKKAASKRKAAPANKGAPKRKAAPAKKVASKRKAASVKKAASKRKAASVKKAASKRKVVPAKKVASKRKAASAKKGPSKRKPAPKTGGARNKSSKISALSSAKSTVHAFKAALKKKQLAVARVAAQKKRAEALRIEKIEKARLLAEKMDASRNQPMGVLARPTGLYDGIRLLEESDVTSFPKKTPYSRQELNRLKTALHKERDKLLCEISSLMGMSQDALEAARENSGYSLHMAEHATDLQTAETNLAVRSYEEERLEKVEEALDRLENNVNHYGLCLASGRKIGIQRLIAQPHAHLCKDLQELYEKIRSRRN